MTTVAAVPELSLRDLSVKAGKTTLLHPTDLTVAPGEWLSIIGPNGAGKSTLLRAIVGATKSSGTITLDGASLGEMKRTERARHVAWVPQNPTIPTGFLVLDYVLLGRTPHRHLLAAERPHDLSVVHRVLQELDLTGFARRDIASLSGGERQRVIIARALAQEAPILLLDEPTTALDLGHQQEVLLLLDQLRTQGRTIVSTMHDLTLAGQFADRLVMLSHGQIAAMGSPSQVLTEQNVSDHYNAHVQITHVNGAVLVMSRIRPEPAPKSNS